MRPASDCPSTVVRSHDERRASTTSESAADGAAGASATSGAAGGVDDAVGEAELVGAAVDGALAGEVDRAAASVAAGSLPDRIHQIVPTKTAIPAAPKSATNIRARPPAGTGTESLGYCDDSNIRDAGCEGDGVCDRAERDGGDGG